MSRNVLEIYARPIFWYTKWLCFRDFKTLNMKRGKENVGKLSAWKSFLLKLGPWKRSPTPLKKPLNLVCLKLYEPCSSVCTRMKPWWWANICCSWWKFKILQYDHSWQLCVLNWLKDEYLWGMHLRFAFPFMFQSFLLLHLSFTNWLPRTWWQVTF